MAQRSNRCACVKISILVEGKTERAFKPHLITFLTSKLRGQMPRLDMFPYDGRIPTGAKLRRVVEDLLSIGQRRSDAVIALTDVYTGTNAFSDAADAKAKCAHGLVLMQGFIHTWRSTISKAGCCRIGPIYSKSLGTAPGGPPEQVDHNRPPSYHVKEIFRNGTCRDDYSKARDANRILQGQDLGIAASLCPELKAFLNTIIGLSGGTQL